MSAAPLVTLPCPAHRTALQAERCLALPVTPPCQSRAALPCWLRTALPSPSRRLAGSAPPSPACRIAPACSRAALPCLRIALPCPRAALLSAAPPCPARAPPCWSPHHPALPARRSAGHRTALPCPRAALLAAALPCHLHCPALAARCSSLAMRRLALPCALP
ncbi:unnamed protein product [Closterium sp. NIES-53]